MTEESIVSLLDKSSTSLVSCPVTPKTPMNQGQEQMTPKTPMYQEQEEEQEEPTGVLSPMEMDFESNKEEEPLIHEELECHPQDTVPTGHVRDGQEEEEVGDPRPHPGISPALCGRG